MEKHKVLVADPISDKGIEALQQDPGLDVDVRIGISPEELLASAHEYEGIIVRSETRVKADVLAKAVKLKAVGRAGVGVDNIDVDAASKAGVIVMNTPAGNTISTAEHAFTLLMSLARNIPQAHAAVSSGAWSANKKVRGKYQGVELNGKTLAILGMGRIGSEVARRAMAFGMRVVAYDPYLSASRARTLRVELAETVDAAVENADFITMHMPLTKDTRHMINAERMARLKPGVRIINCARGGLIDEAALKDALESGAVAGAALDVYEVEPPASDCALFGLPNIVLTPHLGASTAEAQESVGIEIAKAVRDCLIDGAITNAVNMPSVDEKTMAEIGPYLKFAESLGRILSQISPHQAEVLRVNYYGKIGDLDTALISRSALKGYLQIACGEGAVNQVNAPGVAENMGLRFTESHLPTPAEFTDLIEVSTKAGDVIATVGGTFFGKQPRIVRINDRHVEATPEGQLLVIENRDEPGLVGQLGTVLGKHSVNIANMSLSRNDCGTSAFTVLNLDSAVADPVLAEIVALPAVLSARQLRT